MKKKFPVCLLLVGIIVSCCLFVGCERYDDKIQVISDVSKSSPIDVQIYCDYTKHKNFNQWCEDYDISEYSALAHAHILNEVCYQSVKDALQHGEFQNVLCTVEVLNFTYLSKEEFDMDYENLVNIADNLFVTKIVIRNQSDSNGDFRGLSKINMSSDERIGLGYNAPEIHLIIVCNYNKHEKYSKWCEKHQNFEHMSNFERTYLLNEECYGEMPNDFPHGNIMKFSMGMEVLYYAYSSVEDLEKDYPDIIEFAQKEYVTRIHITEMYLIENY